MKKTGKIMLISIRGIFALLAVVFCLLICAFALAENGERKSESLVTLISDETADVNIVTADGTDYSLIYSSDSYMGDSTFATELKAALTAAPKSFRPTPDTKAEVEHEILIGNTNRTLSKELLAAVKAAGPEDELYVWGYAYKNGKLAYVANGNVAFELGKEHFLALVSSDGTLSVPSELYVIETMTFEEYKEYMKDKENEYLASLIDMNNAFTDKQFDPGGLYKPMIAEDGSGWYTSTKSGEPWVYPTAGQHPRYIITEGNLEKLRDIMSMNEDPSSEYYHIAKNFWELVEAGPDKHLYGIFPEVKGASGEIYRYDESILAIISAKSLAYLITGEELYAYEAIVCMKNAVLTLHYTADLHPDVYHGPSHLMVILSAVYDWCYDILSEEDKWQFIYGTAQILGAGMEDGYRYPPSGFNGVNGHGTGPQLLRDWMSVATVFYDEAPDWYRYVAGRYFNEFLPVANAQFENGWVSQGTATYNGTKARYQGWAAYLIKTSTGENFLTEGGGLTMYYYISHLTPRQGAYSHQQYYFETGDGSRSPGGRSANSEEFFVLAALYNDPVVLAWAKLLTADFRYYRGDTWGAMGPDFQACFAAAVDYNGEGAMENIDTIQYFAYPAAQMTAREAWGDPNSVTVLMRLMNLTMANHDCQDHGTFQIYYKGLLAGTSGAYAKYASPAHIYYHQATVAHNGLLVFNPTLADAEPKYGDSGDIANVSRYFYSGSQHKNGVQTSSVSAWLESAHMSETTGAAYGYNRDGTSKYAYLAGDLSDAYDPETVDFIGRKMFTLFTGDENFPVLFFTFDQILSDSESYTKHWLLHTMKEPVIDQDALSATVINGDGKMYLESLYGADSIVKIGGEGKAWWINGYFKDSSDRGSWDARTQSFTDPENVGSWVEGKNALDTYATNDDAENIWGRIELRTEGEKYSKFFTVMAVTDTANGTVFEIEKFANADGTLFGAKFGGSIVTFVDNAEKLHQKYHKELSFTTEGKGLYEYYIAGLEAGTWNVKVDGVSVAYSISEEEGGLITFTAPAGDVTVTPGTDVIADDGGKIQYITGGGLVPEDTEYVYKSDLGYQLPTNVTRGDDVFVGWYTSPSYEPESAVSEVPAGTTGTFKVYAKWINNFLNEDFSSTFVNLEGAGQKINGVSYQAGKPGASMITKTDENGVGYLEWIEGTKDPFLAQSSWDKNFSKMESEEKCVSFTFSLSLNEGNTPMKTHCRLIAKQDVNGAAISSSHTYIFTTDTDGNVNTISGNRYGTLSYDKVLNIRVAVDFKNGEMRYYDEDYNLIVANTFTPPASTKATTTEEFMKCLTEYLWYFYAETSSAISDAGLRIYGMRVQEGDEFAGKAVVRTEGIKYNANGAKMPEDVQLDFNKDGTTPLYTDMSLDGFIFDGWYTTSTFDEGTRTEYVPEGFEGLYEVYAKWKVIFLDEDYETVDIDHSEKAETIGDITYNGTGKVGSSFKTEADGDGNKYLVWTVGERDSLMTVTNAVNNVYTMKSTAISYTITIGEHGDAGVPDFEFRIIGKSNTDGTAGSSEIYFAFLRGGKVTLGTSSTVIGTVTDEPLTLRIVLDFEAGTIIAYDEAGCELAAEPMPAVPAATGAATHLEWKECFRSYLYYTRRIGYNGAAAGQAIRYYGVRIEEGNAFASQDGTPDEPLKDNSIIYETNFGTLPEDAPKEYDKELGTQLPVPERAGYVFDGWYTTESFDAGTRAEKIEAGTVGTVKVYAKWLVIFVDEDFTDTDINIEEANKTANNITYAGASKPGSSYKTERDEAGNKYLVWTVGESDSFMTVNNPNANVSTMHSSAVSYTLILGKHADAGVPNFEFRLRGSGGDIYFGYLVGGEFRLGSKSGPVVATVTEEVTYVRIVIDFAAGKISGYDEYGNVINSIAAPEVEKEALNSYLLYTRRIDKNGAPAGQAVRYYGIRIEEGNAFI